VSVPEKIGNLCFGGPDGDDLYIAATSSLYRIKTTTRNAPRPA
jgi:gluconolactonase